MSARGEAGDLAAALREWAARFGERPAVVGEHGALSFTTLDQAADRWAAAFTAAGCAGRHVGLLGANTPAWLAAAFGVWRAGATLVPLSTFVTARELRELVAHADLYALVVQPRFESRDFAAMVAALPSATRPPHLFELSSCDPGDHRQPGSGSPLPVSRIDPESIACILYTSGTTGQPKGVMLSHCALLATVRPTVTRGGLAPDDALLSTLPLFWVAGLAIRALPTLASGCALVLIERFTPDAVLAALRRHRPTALHLRPPQVAQLLTHPEFDPALLAPVRRGGGRVEWFHPHLDPDRTRLITGYGMTEMAGYVTATAWNDPPDVRAHEIGTPLPGIALRITDDAGGECPPGTVGEVRVRGPGLFSGYYRQPPGTGLDGDGFFCTGDLGTIDPAGRFRFAGRRKDLLRVKGINVSPAEVEQVLATHPAVAAAYVIGLPPDGLEQEVVALIVPRTGHPWPERELRALAAEALSHYKRPAHYLAVSAAEVPLGATAKPQRAQLAALAAARLHAMAEQSLSSDH